MRARLDRLSFDAAAFTGRYTNLIVEKKDLGTANGLAASVTNPTLFQTVNVDKASISGFVDAAVRQFGGLDGCHVNGLDGALSHRPDWAGAHAALRRGDERVYTQAFAGCFNDDDRLRAEFVRAISGLGR